MDPAETKSSGWYPDPSNPSAQRWWNGISWGDQTRPANPPAATSTAPATAPRVVDPYAPVEPTLPTPPVSAAARDGQFRNVNPTGYVGVALGFVAILFNVFCIPSILALILSAIGVGRARTLSRSGHRVTGLVWCVAGLIMGIAETLFYVAGAVN